MARPKRKTMFIYSFALSIMEEIYKEKKSGKVRRKDLPKFPTKKALIDFLLKQSEVLSSEDYSISPESWGGEKIVCRTTVSNAVNMLIEDNAIAKGEDGYEFVPHMREELEKYPILDIASRVEVSVGVPENLLFLNVKGGFAHQLAEYLSAQFYKGDVIFIPLGQVIMCIGVLPQNVIQGKEKQNRTKSSMFRERIEAVLHMFKLEYPEFPYGSHYEMAYAAHHNPTIRGQLRAMAKYKAEQETALNIIMGYTANEVYSSVVEALEKVPDMEDDLMGKEQEIESEDEETEEEHMGDATLREEIEWFFDDKFDDFL